MRDGGRHGSRAARAPPAQWARRALPFTVSEQGEVNRAGLPARAPPGHRRARPAAGAPTSRARLDAFGRAALRAVTALDGAGARDASGETRPGFAGETSGIVTLRNVLPDWSVRLLVLASCCPRCSPRSTPCSARAAAGSPSGPGCCGSPPPRCLPCSLGVAAACSASTGALPAPPAPVLPAALALDARQAVALATVALGGRRSACWPRALATRRAARARGEPGGGRRRGGGGCA